VLSSIKNAANTLAYATFGYDNNAAGKLSSITYKGCNKMKTKRIVKLMCKFVTTLLLAKSLALAGVNKINIQGTFFQNDGVTPITGQNHVVDVRLYTNATPTLGEPHISAKNTQASTLTATANSTSCLARARFCQP